MTVGSINFGGLASGIDTQALVQAILKAERRPAERLESRQALYRRQKSALEEMRSKLRGFEGALRDLSAETTFRGRSTTLGEEGFFRAAAGAGGETGLFSVEVLALAAAHKVRSAGFAAPDQGLVADGTITIQSGSREAITIDVSAAAGNNSLAAIRDAINSADAGVRAAILFDGTDHRLVVRSTETGVDNALAISDGTDLGLADAANLVTAAADARVRVDGVEATSSSNKVSGMIPGTVLELVSLTTQAVSLEIRDDREGVEKAVSALVKAYNEVIDFFTKQFDRENPGPLAGSGTARRVQQGLQSLVTGGVDGIALGDLRSLSAVGVSFDGRSGKMSLDTATLRSRLEGGFEDVARLFLASGRASDPRVRYASATTATAAGEYAIRVSTAAEQATVVGSGPISASGLGRDETLTISAGGSSVAVSLTTGMTGTEVVDAINAALRDAKVAATARNDGGALRISSRDVGSAASISVVSDQADPGDGTGSGFGTTAATDEGVDVAGTIGGVDAVGTGQVLTGADGGPYAGLAVRITASAANLAAKGGDFGTIAYSRGLVRTLLGEIQQSTRPADGTIASAVSGLDADLRRISDDIARIDRRLERRRATLIRMFGAAEKAIAALQAQQAQLGNVVR